MLQSACSTDSFPAHELTVRCLGAMTNGSFTPLAMMAGKEATFATLREISRRKPWFTRLAQEPWAAMLVSEQTRQFYAHGGIMERWLSHAVGVYRMAMEEHLPLTLITEQDLVADTPGTFRFGDFGDSIFATDPRLKHLVPNGQASFKGPMIRMRGKGESMMPAILYFPEGSPEPFPCALTGEQGQGRVVYFAGGVDAAYFSARSR